MTISHQAAKVHKALNIYNILLMSGQDTVQLSDEQVIMLQLSDEDMKNGKLIAQDQLNKDDLQWLSEQ